MQKDDVDDRSPPIGLFNTAESYWQAGIALGTANLRTTHPNAPISFLYYHAIELYLKAYLKLNGYTSDQLRSRKFGHRICCLSEKSAECGLRFEDEDNAVFSLIATTDAVIRSRYFERGYFTWPANEALQRTCKSLRTSVGQALKKENVPVRGV
jgi:hypothetical protein